MSRKKERKAVKVPRKVAVRRSATRDHQNKYAKHSKHKHSAYGVLEEQTGVASFDSGEFYK